MVTRKTCIILAAAAMAGLVSGVSASELPPRTPDMYNRIGECTKQQTARLEEANIRPIDYETVREIPGAQDQIRAVIKQASRWPCLPYGHWFRISFDPSHKDVRLREDLLAPYREKGRMSIFIQHEYKDLEAAPLGISMIVYFGGRPEEMLIPYDAITWFDDPGHEFRLEPKKHKTQ